MTDIGEVWPLFGLRVTCGPLELRPLRDEHLAELVEVARAGVHDPVSMPFLHPWTDAPEDQLTLNVVQYHWRKRAEFSKERWSLELGVHWDGRLVGTQGVTTEDFLITRTGETGSWLGLVHQGQGIGTLIRQAICTLCFDHLGFEQVTSGAFVDNPASLAVSRKVGYVANGQGRLKRREEMALHQYLVLTPEALVRPEQPVHVEGVDGVRRLVGLDS
ncbi:MAG: GNAT family N-acetyltransferase [Nocardioidaceae bacterium]